MGTVGKDFCDERWENLTAREERNEKRWEVNYNRWEKQFETNLLSYGASKKLTGMMIVILLLLGSVLTVTFIPKDKENKKIEKIDSKIDKLLEQGIINNKR